LSEQLDLVLLRGHGDLPRGWSAAPVRAVATLVRGVTYKKAESAREPATGMVGVLRATNIGSEIDLEELVYVPESNVKPEQMVRAGDVLMATSSGSLSVVGKCAPARRDLGAAFGAFCMVVRPVTELAPLLGQFFRTPSYRSHVSRVAAGVNINNLKRGDIEPIIVPIPPLPEQRRIVAEIEKQFTRLDAAVANLERVKANLKRARASVLKAAVEGRLVPTEASLARAEGRDYEPASVLLERILEERERRHREENPKKKYKPPVEPDTEGLPELPGGWAWVTINQTSTLVRNGYSKKPDDDGETPILRISAVRPCFVDREDSRRLRTPLSELEGATAKPGDLLFTRYNGTRALVGVSGLLRGEGPVVHPDKLIRVVPIAPLVSGAFVEKAVSTGESRAFIERRIRTTAGQSGVSGSDIKQLPFPLPPMAEQKRIVVEVERQLSRLDALESVVAANLARSESLRQSILKRAFEGKLVPQDPNDEPASALLERIQAETAATKPKKKRAKKATKRRKNKPA